MRTINTYCDNYAESTIPQIGMSVILNSGMSMIPKCGFSVVPEFAIFVIFNFDSLYIKYTKPAQPHRIQGQSPWRLILKGERFGEGETVKCV